MPAFPVRVGHGEIIPRDVERCPVPTVRPLHLDEARRAVGREAGDVVAGAVADLPAGPDNPPRQIAPAGEAKCAALMRQNPLLSGPAQSPFSLVPLGDTEAHGDGSQLLGFLGGGAVLRRVGAMSTKRSLGRSAKPEDAAGGLSVHSGFAVCQRSTASAGAIWKLKRGR